MHFIAAHFTSADIAADDLDHAGWKRADAVRIERYWSGVGAPPERHAEARVLWSESALLVRFVCRQAEPLVVSDAPRLDRKTIGLWDRDVCEMFIAPRANEPERYFEFEVAPTGEWLDLSIRWRPEGRETVWDYHSGMTAAALVEHGAVTLAMRIPFAGLGATPRAGDSWRANLYRCIGALGDSRGYLAWRPTLTPQPNFHVPHRFGRLEFIR